MPFTRLYAQQRRRTPAEHSDCYVDHSSGIEIV